MAKLNPFLKIKHIWDVHFIRIQMIISIIIGTVAYILIRWFGGALIVNNLLFGNRGAIYGTLASIFGALLGFVITAVSIIMGFSNNDKLDFFVKSPHYATLGKAMNSTIEALSFSTVMMVLGLVIDRDSSPHHLILCLMIGATVLSLLRLGTCLWLLEKIITLVMR